MTTPQAPEKIYISKLTSTTIYTNLTGKGQVSYEREKPTDIEYTRSDLAQQRLKDSQEAQQQWVSGLRRYELEEILKVLKDNVERYREDGSNKRLNEHGRGMARVYWVRCSTLISTLEYKLGFPEKPQE